MKAMIRYSHKIFRVFHSEEIKFPVSAATTSIIVCLSASWVKHILILLSRHKATPDMLALQKNDGLSFSPFSFIFYSLAPK